MKDFIKLIGLSIGIIVITLIYVVKRMIDAAHKHSQEDWMKEFKGNESKEIRCGKLEGGTVCYGDVVETGLPDEQKETTYLIKDGKKYEVSILREVKE